METRRKEKGDEKPVQTTNGLVLGEAVGERTGGWSSCAGAQRGGGRSLRENGKKWGEPVYISTRTVDSARTEGHRSRIDVVKDG